MKRKYDFEQNDLKKYNAVINPRLLNKNSITGSFGIWVNFSSYD
jgi:hypothetical protein